jgi:glycosyltransferase involved in cell wall biosynthesis
MNKSRPPTEISVIVPVTADDKPYLDKLIHKISDQSYKNIELILISDKKISFPAHKFPLKTIVTEKIFNPSEKRNLGLKSAKGKFLAFIDSDAYPDSDWLKKALPYFRNPAIAAVGGPGLTPPEDSLLQRLSGHVWCSRIGTGGVGTYRCLPGPARYVDDYPTFNLIVRKSDLWKIGGFTAPYWPGEDTSLCHDLVYKLNKKIIYSPKVIVFHHRRKLFGPHLKQIRLYGVHRGYLARTLPKTSRKISYMLPSLSILILLFTYPVHRLALSLGHPVISRVIGTFYLFSIIVYLAYLTDDLLKIYKKERNPVTAFLFIPAVISTHAVYGLFFLSGFFSGIRAENDKL